DEEPVDRHLHRQRQAEDAAPVLHDEGDVPQLEARDEVEQEPPMEIERVEPFILRLVRAPEADKVGRDDAPASGDEARKHLPVEIAPGRLAMQAEKRASAAPLVEVMHAVAAPLNVMRRVAKTGQIGEALIGGAHEPIVE